MNKLISASMLLASTVLLGCSNDDNDASISSTLSKQEIERSGGSNADDTQQPSAVRAVSKLQEEEQPRLDTPFYVYGLGQPTSTNFWQGLQFFGTMDKVGVLKSVMDEIPNRQADLIFIRDQKAERQEYLIQNGVALDSQCLWDVGVEVTDVVNGKRRLGVTASYGKDIEYNGGVGPDVVQNVKEIWELQEGGANPILLERHSLPIQTTVYTQAEVPYTPQLPSPPGTVGY
jgi:hypothetical protein